MADALNMRPFGFNVMSPKKAPTPENTAGKTIEKAMDSLWGPVLNYLEKNEDVFSGSVANSINKVNIHTMRLGMAMSSNEVKKTLDTKM